MSILNINLTEEDWLEGDYVLGMLEYVAGWTHNRRFLLLALACNQTWSGNTFDDEYLFIKKKKHF